MTAARWLAAVAVALGLAAAASAQERYDLRARQAVRAGDAFAVHQVIRQEQQVTLLNADEVLREDQERLACDVRFEDAVEEVDPQGRPTQLLRTYRELTDLTTQEALELGEGIQARLSVRDGQRSCALSQAGEPPELLQRLLGQQSGPLDELQADRRLLLPAEPVAIGDTWVIPLEQAAAAFGLPGASVVRDQSQADGRLRSLEDRDGVPMLRVVVRVRLALSEFEGMPAPEPVRFEMDLEALLAADEVSPLRDVRLEGSIRGECTPPDAPEGVLARLSLTLSSAASTRSLP